MFFYITHKTFLKGYWNKTNLFFLKRNNIFSFINKFTIGWGWESDYGSPQKLEDFLNLYSYSPYHNIQDGVCYPPTLVTTSDRDDRVVPSHSYKFAARLQNLQGCKNPIMLRVETRAGHGAGKPKDKQISEIADIYGTALNFIN